MSNLITPELRLERAPLTPKLSLRLENLARLVKNNPPLHDVRCLFPDVCKVMGDDFYVSKTKDGISVRDMEVGGTRIAQILPAGR